MTSGVCSMRSGVAAFLLALHHSKRCNLLSSNLLLCHNSRLQAVQSESCFLHVSTAAVVVLLANILWYCPSRLAETCLIYVQEEAVVWHDLPEDHVVAWLYKHEDALRVAIEPEVIHGPSRFGEHPVSPLFTRFVMLRIMPALASALVAVEVFSISWLATA